MVAVAGNRKTKPKANSGRGANAERAGEISLFGLPPEIIS